MFISGRFGRLTGRQRAGRQTTAGIGVWIAVGIALTGCGCREDQTYQVPGLIKMLKSSDVSDRYTALNGLQRYGPEAAPAVESLVQALNDSDPIVRCGAIYALAAIGNQAAPADGALLHSVDDPVAEVREAAVYAIPLVFPTDASALEPLKRALKDPDQRVRTEAATAVRRIKITLRYHKP